MEQMSEDDLRLHVDSVQREVEIVRKYLTELSNDLGNFNYNLQCQVGNLQERQAELKQRITDELRDEIENVNAELESLRQEEEKFAEEKENLDFDLQNLRTIFLTKDVNNPKFRNVKRAVEKVKQKYQIFQNKTKNSRSTLENLLEAATDVQKTIGNMENQGANLFEEMENLKKLATTLLDKFKNLESDCKTARKECGEMLKEFETLLSERKQLAENFQTNSQQRIDGLQLKFKNLSSKLSCFSGDSKRLEKDAENLMSNVANLQSQAEEVLKNGDVIPRELGDYLRIKKDACAEITQLSETMKNLREDVQKTQNLLKKIENIETEETAMAFENSFQTRKDSSQPQSISITNYFINFFSNQAIQGDGNKTGTISLSLSEVTVIVITCVFAVLCVYFTN